MGYPVEAVLDELLAGLSKSPNMLLIAPPGAGKTTIIPPILLRQDWCQGQILLLSPRRIAAQMAAERMADLAGEPVGGTIGYATRMDSKQSSGTRLLVLTEGIFRKRIIADPELTGVSAVLFDEVHERSLDSDFGLALALDAQAAFRPDLRLLAMSATLDGNRFAALMNDAPVVRSAGKSFPLTIRYIGRRAEMPVEEDVARAVRIAMRERAGDILIFLPGSREIDRVFASLSGGSADIAPHRLYGGLDPAEQRAALRPDPGGKRKVILATNIAETSLTIDGVRIVIDSGLARRARYDAAVGVTRLVTERASLSAAAQRAGRAARQGPGFAYRMWEEAGNGGLSPFDPPEILASDLAGLTLDCAHWGEGDPANLRWLDAPPPAALKEARQSLIALRAIGHDGGITPHGKILARMPLPPPLAHMVTMAAQHGQAERAAMLAVLLQERGLGGPADDLDLRLERFGRESGRRADAARRLAMRLADLAPKAQEQGHGQGQSQGQARRTKLSVGALIALAFPGRVARRRGAAGDNWLSVMGRGFWLKAGSSLASAQWLAVADLQGAASRARILSAARLDPEDIDTLFSAQIESNSLLYYDRDNDRVEAKVIRQLGAIKLAESMRTDITSADAATVLCGAVAEFGLDALAWPAAAIALRQRAAFAGNADIGEAALLASLDEWLAPIVGGARRLRDIPASALTAALESKLGWEGQQQLAKIAPSRFISPAGTVHEIDYTAAAGPTAELRVQALFGLDVHPAVGADHIPLVLSLTSPAGRPIQTTRDLPSFWRGSWRDIAKEMRGRYPKHHWPDAPWDAKASLKTKNAQARSA